MNMQMKMKRILDNVFLPALLLIMLPITSVESLTVRLGNKGLTEVPGGISNDTVSLYLNRNSLTSVHAYNFRWLHRLQNLYLNENKLTRFPNLTYVSSTLHVLYLYHNQINYVEYDLLNELTSLQTLHLSSNQLESFPDAPGPGQTLQNLYLHENKFTLFPNLTNIGRKVVTLYVRRNTIEEVPVYSIDGLETIKNLYLSNNLLTTFPNLTSIGQSLEHLELYSNKISFIHFDVLNALVKLRVLHLQPNALKSFPNCPGPGSTLTTLYLRNNPIAEFPDLSEIGKKLTHLEVQVVYGNTTAPLVLGSLPKVNNFNLQSSGLNFFPNFTSINAIQHLNLDRNEITTIPMDLLNYLTKISRVWLGYNKLVSFTAVVWPSSTLTELHLNNNLLTEMPSLQAQNLLYLYLHYNLIQFIGREKFKNLSNLRRLYLYRNKLSEFPDFFYIRQSIEYLYVYDNMIESIKPDYLNFTGNTKSLRLYLHNNRLKVIPPLYAPKVYIVHLVGNVFHCDHHMVDLLTNIVGKYMTCSTPAQLAGKKVSTLTLADLRISVVEVLHGVISDDWKIPLADNDVNTCATITPGTRILSTCSPFPSMFIFRLTRTSLLTSSLAVMVNVSYTGTCEAEKLAIYTHNQNSALTCSGKLQKTKQQMVQTCPLVGETKSNNGVLYNCGYLCRVSVDDVYLSLMDTKNSVQICSVSYHKVKQLL